MREYLPVSDDFGELVAELRPVLMRYARSQLRNEAWAEDAVSETMLAALEGRSAFSGRSQLKTWLVGILKHKLIDKLRRHCRETSIFSDEDSIELDETLFLADGHWREFPSDGGDPVAALGERQFFSVLEACMELLPTVQGRVFLMREWLGLEVDEVQCTLGISKSNLYVMLYRARLRLAECLNQRWFEVKDPAGGEI
jgi:RNA polymerase sigma-70 factor (ECF subfamily)